MGHKTLITICQSGGEFAKNKDDGSLSYVNNCGDAHAIDIHNETKFDDFKMELAGLWNYSPESVTIKYILPGHGKTLITISDDRELKRMIEFHENSPIADVYVTGRDVVIHHEVFNRPAASSSSRPNMSDAVVPVVVDTPVNGNIVDSAAPAPVCYVPLESISPNQPPTIAVTAASAVRGVELENTITDQVLANVHESHEAFHEGSKKKMSRVKMEAVILRSIALNLMKHNDCVVAWKRLLEARASDPGLEYIDELIKVCDIVCAAQSQGGGGVDWCSVLEINEESNESEIEVKYSELIRTLEQVKNKFPEIQSALSLIEKAYTDFCSRRASSLVPCGFIKPLDIAYPETANINMRATSQVSSGTKRNASEDSDNSSLICNSVEQPLKRVRSLGGNDFEVMGDIQSLNILVGKASGLCTAERKTRLNEGEGSLEKSSGDAVKSLVHKEPALEFHDCSNHNKAGKFTVGQFLAVYDQDKMPRLYAQIIGIESCCKKETSSRLYVRWLRPAPINPDERKWHEAGLPVSCGFFKIDRVGKCDISAISHLVPSFQEYHYSDKLFEIYPQEGQVWALYEDWKLCSDPKTRKGCKFMLVEILTDYSPSAGVKVASLGKVAGNKTIFRRSGESYHIAASKLFGFSHNIPVRSAGDMKGLFPGTVIDLDPLSIPDDVTVDKVSAEFSNGTSSIMHQNSGSAAITSLPNYGNCN